MIRRLLVALILLLPSLAAGQIYYSLPPTQRYINGTYFVCGFPAIGDPCSNQIAVYPNSSLITPLPQPVATNIDGSANFWLPAATTHIVIEVQPPYSIAFDVLFGGGGGGGSGTVNNGTANQLAFYPSNGTAVSGNSLLTDNGTQLAYNGAGGFQVPKLTGNGGILSVASQLAFVSGLGAISHIVGPTDQPFVLGTQNNQNLNLTPNGSGTVAISSATSVGGKLSTVAPSSNAAGFFLPPGTAPATPINGDLWATTAGVFAQVNGSTVGPFGPTGALTFPVTVPNGLGSISHIRGPGDQPLQITTQTNQNINLSPNGTGTINNNANTILAGPRPFIDPTAAIYAGGMDPTNTLDSTAAFNAAAAACAATGQPIYFPEGTYKLGNVTVTAPCTFTSDALFPAHFIRNASTTTATFQAGWFVINNSNITVRGIEFDGNSGSFTGNCVVILGAISDIRFQDNWVHNCDGSGVHVVGISASAQGPTRVDISGNKIVAGASANAQGAIFGQSSLSVIHIHDNPLLDGTNLAAGSSVNFLSQGLTSSFNAIDISNNPQILCPKTGSSWCIQMGGFNAYEVIAPRVENNGMELTGTNAGFVSIPIAISGKLILGNHMNTHFIDLMRCGALTSSACANDGQTQQAGCNSSSTTTFCSAGGSFTAADTGRTLQYVCGGTLFVSLVTFSTSSQLTLTTASTCSGTAEAWYLFGYSATAYGIEGGGSTGTIIEGNTLYMEGSQGGTCIGLDGSSYTVVSGNECQGIPENGGQGIALVLGTTPQTIATLSQSGSTVTTNTSGALNATWQPATTIAITTCGTGFNTCRTSTTGTTGASTTLTDASGTFTAADTNRFINVYGCVATSGSNPSGMSLNNIVTVTSATQVTLAFACTQTQTGTATYQVVTSTQLFTTTILNINYSRTGGTFNFQDATTGASCASNCGGMMQTVSYNLIKGNIVQMPQALKTSGNVFGLLAKTQSSNPEYGYGNTFEGNKVIGASGSGNAQFCFGQTGATTPLLDQTEWKNNSCNNNNNGFTLNVQHQNTKLRDNEFNSVNTAYSTFNIGIGDIVDFVAPLATSQLGGTGLGTSPTLSTDSSTRSIRITVGTTPAASTATITGILPPAPQGWNCTPLNDQTTSTAVNRQTGSTTTSITWTFTVTAAAGDVLNASCTPL